MSLAAGKVTPTPSLSTADHSVSPPALGFPREYNAAHDLIERNLVAGRGGKVAYIDDAGRYTFENVAHRVSRFGSALRALGVEMEQRVMLALVDTIDFPTAFLGSIRAGIVPVAVNPLLAPRDYRHLLTDSRARALVVSQELLPKFAPLLGDLPFLKHVIVSEPADGSHLSLDELLARGVTDLPPAPTTCDDACFWLYTSGSTGAPKAAVHVHSSLVTSAELYGRGVLGVGETDVVFSAPKLFFAYGLGNAVSFPLACGATAVLMRERATPAAVFRRLTAHRATVFFGVPTLYASLLASPELPPRQDLALRLCGSAGEALPPHLGRGWRAATGVDILDGIGSTEMLQTFLSNRPGDVRPGTTGTPVPGFEVRIVDEQGHPVRRGELGELLVQGPTCAAHYWNNRERSRSTFMGGWTRSGDKYRQDEDGYYVYGGRSDDMLKVSGMYVSPAEVEAALASHSAVLEAAVVGAADGNNLVKPKAYVVLKPGQAGSEALKAALQRHVKDVLAPYKYPRWIEFLDELPKTATGKIQRFKLRA